MRIYYYGVIGGIVRSLKPNSVSVFLGRGVYSVWNFGASIHRSKVRWRLSVTAFGLRYDGDSTVLLDIF